MKVRKRPYPHFKFPDEITISFKLLNEIETSWHGGGKNVVYGAKTENYGWFPTEIIMGVTKGRFDSNHPKSVENGAFIGNNLGTMGILIKADKLQNAIQTLKEVGYNIEMR